MAYKVFVDGQQGTTGLEIYQRLEKRDDVEILKIDPALRKDVSEKKRLINLSDVTILCLPDDAARESVALIENPDVRVIDASTAHRTNDAWVYGIPEFSAAQREAIKNAKRVCVPGCYATGFNVIMHPLVKEGIVPKSYLATCHAVSGYSGGGRQLIEAVEDPAQKYAFASPSFYGLTLAHKHLPEMQKVSGLDNAPLFSPMVCNYYRGMNVAVPLFLSALNKKMSAKGLSDFFADYYAGQRFVLPQPFDALKNFERGYVTAEGCNNTNELKLFVFGNDEQAIALSQLDNLGKGASGAAIQLMNIMLGVDEEYSL